MLVLSRRAGEAVRIELADDVPPFLTVGDLFSQGPIEITVTRISNGAVRIGISADQRLTILRSELRNKKRSIGCG